MDNRIITNTLSLIDHFISLIPKYDQEGRSIEVTSKEILFDESITLQHYIATGTSSTATCSISYLVKNSEGITLLEDSFLLEVPMSIDGVFIIEGKPRYQVTELVQDSCCRIYHKPEETTVVLNSTLRVCFRGSDTIVTLIDEEGNLKEGGVDILKEGNLTLTKREALKIQYKLKLPTPPTNFSLELAKSLATLDESQTDDNIIDKLFLTPEKALSNYLIKVTREGGVLRAMRKNFYKYGKIYINDLQRMINKYFMIADQATIEIPQNINTLLTTSLKDKIIFPKYVSYNESYSDIIDMVNTPENGNVNRINELNVCSTIIDSEAYITCYKYPSFDKITIPYLEYLNSKVILSKSVDYSNSVVDSQPTIKYQGRLMKVQIDSLSNDESIFIEPKEDDRLSVTTRQIPMINLSDSVRVAMGGGMSKQAIELENHEPALVSSGNEETDVNRELLRIYWKKEDKGVVKEILEDAIIIESNGEEEVIAIPKTSVGLNYSSISFFVTVKKGDVVNKGDLLVRPESSTNRGFELGVNAHVAYTFYKGYNHEDAIIISESFAERLSCFQIVDVPVNISCYERINSHLGIGDKVSYVTPIICREDRFSPSAKVEKLLESPLFDFLRDPLSFYKNDVTTPNNIQEGYISKITLTMRDDYDKIFKEFQVPEDDSKNLLRVLSTIETDKSLNYQNFTERIPERLRESTPPSVDLPRDNRVIATLNIRIIKVSKAGVGTKLCNRWGSKGEVSLVLPDKEMLMDENGKPFDAILNPPSVVKRVNPAQLVETLLTKILEKVYVIAKEYVEKNDFEGLRAFLRNYYFNRFDNSSDEELREGINSGKFFLAFKTGSFSKYNRSNVLQMAESLGVKETEEVTDPDPEIGTLENEVLTGQSYYYRLYHNAEFSAKVTSSLVTSKEPRLGRGLYRSEGQKLGEMEKWALMAKGTLNLIQPKTIDLEGLFINELLLSGYCITRF